MSAFDLVFALFSLLLGLAIAEVLGGFSRALKLKRGARAVRIGWLTPLLGLVIILDLTSFWIVAFDMREHFEVQYLTLIAVLAIVGTYYLAASLIFPDDPEEWPDFDAHYDRQNWLVILGLLAANVGSWIGQIALLPAATGMEETALTPDETVDAVAGLAILVLLIALIFVKGRRANVALLAALVLLLAGSAVAEAVV